MIGKEKKETPVRIYDEIPAAKKTEGLQKLEKLVAKDPAKVAQMLKNWLSEE